MRNIEKRNGQEITMLEQWLETNYRHFPPALLAMIIFAARFIHNLEAPLDIKNKVKLATGVLIAGCLALTIGPGLDDVGVSPGLNYFICGIVGAMGDEGFKFVVWIFEKRTGIKMKEKKDNVK